VSTFKVWGWSDRGQDRRRIGAGAQNPPRNRNETCLGGVEKYTVLRTVEETSTKAYAAVDGSRLPVVHRRLTSNILDWVEVYLSIFNV
jgi:hypothetical protein